MIEWNTNMDEAPQKFLLIAVDYPLLSADMETNHGS
jgi:hypothetical protein